MPKTKIQWCDYSWPVVNGCRRISPGCQACYAERLTATRLRHTPKYQGLAEMTPSGPRWTGETRLWEPDLMMPLKLKKPSRIFVADMGDLFYEGVPDWWIDQVFAMMASCPQHTFQVLTKRPQRMEAYFRHAGREDDDGLRFRWAQEAYHLLGRDPGEATDFPLPNVHLGISTENREMLLSRYEALARTEAAIRFLSYEPALGPLHVTDLRPILPDWVICGAESGPGRRPMAVEWAIDVRNECQVLGIPFFMKQMEINGKVTGDIRQFPEALQVREWPQEANGGAS
jgi:protein gp37